MLAVNCLLLTYLLTVHGREVNRDVEVPFNEPSDSPGPSENYVSRKQLEEARRSNQHHYGTEHRIGNLRHRHPTVKDELEPNRRLATGNIRSDEIYIQHKTDIHNRETENGNNLHASHDNRIETNNFKTNNGTADESKMLYEYGDEYLSNTKPPDLKATAAASTLKIYLHFDEGNASNENVTSIKGVETTTSSDSDAGSNIMKIETKVIVSTSRPVNNVTGVTIDQRSSFNGGQCASGFAKVKGICVEKT